MKLVTTKIPEQTLLNEIAEVTKLKLKDTKWITLSDTGLEYGTPIKQVKNELFTITTGIPVLIHSTMYPDDWKLIPRFVKENRPIIAYFAENDYLIFQNQKIIKRETDSKGVARYIWSIINSMLHPQKYSLLDLNIMEVLQKHYSENTETVFKKLMQLLDTTKYKELLDIIIKGLDMNLDLYRTRGYTTKDLYKAKLLHALYFKFNTHKDYIREYRGLSDEDAPEQNNPREQAELFADACKKLLNIHINVDDIFTEVELVPYSTDYIEVMFDLDNDTDLHFEGAE